MNYFVMLETQSGGITPLVRDDDELALFDRIDEAINAGSQNPLGQVFGYEVFERGCGEAMWDAQQERTPKGRRTQSYLA